MNNFYHINHLPKLDTFNKIHINYISKSNNNPNNNLVINKQLDLRKDIICLITSFFGIQPNIYGQKRYNTLNKELKLKLNFKTDTIKYNKTSGAYLKHNLTENRDFFIDNKDSFDKINCTKKKTTSMESIDNKIIHYFEEIKCATLDINNKYHNIDNSIVFEWYLLPYLKLFVKIGDYMQNKCIIFIEIDKVEKKSIIKNHATLINNTIKKFDIIFNQVYQIES
jgi:hypothetical protein